MGRVSTRKIMTSMYQGRFPGMPKMLKIKFLTNSIEKPAQANTTRTSITWSVDFIPQRSLKNFMKLPFPINSRQI